MPLEPFDVCGRLCVSYSCSILGFYYFFRLKSREATIGSLPKGFLPLMVGS